MFHKRNLKTSVFQLLQVELPRYLQQNTNQLHLGLEKVNYQICS